MLLAPETYQQRSGTTISFLFPIAPLFREPDLSVLSFPFLDPQVFLDDDLFHTHRVLQSEFLI